MTELIIDQAREARDTATPGLSHLRFLVWIDRTGLPEWQIAVTSFLILVIFGIVNLVLNRIPNPAMYSNVIAFVAIITFFQLFYFRMGRGWQKDLKALIEFDSSLTSVLTILEPTRRVVGVEVVLIVICALINSILLFGAVEGDRDLTFSAFVTLYYSFQYLFVILSIDIVIRQLIMLYRIADQIKIDLLQSDAYTILGNVMLRFIKLYIFGICVITFSLNIFVEGKMGTGQMMLELLPFILPGVLVLGSLLIPYNHFKNRMRIAKTLELNHIQRAINGDKAHLSSSLIGRDADKLTLVDLLYYEDKIRKIKEWPFTDRIRSMLFFGVLPPLTWVIAALIEIFIESVI
ncbi:MAG: hypothetical protein JKY88_14190 [Pseudomonadales bacterium]|nr:hypothetical protein [Pseudomonadales bacterium]